MFVGHSGEQRARDECDPDPAYTAVLDVAPVEAEADAQVRNVALVQRAAVSAWQAAA
jgi:hypothetical protein